MDCANAVDLEHCPVLELVAPLTCPSCRPLAHPIAEIASTPLVPRTSAHLFAQEKVLPSFEDFHQGRCISYT